jgi:hypothetical protein
MNQSAWEGVCTGKYLSSSGTWGDLAVRNLRANQKRQKTKRSNAARFKGDGEGGLKRGSVVCRTVGPEACRGGLGFSSSSSVSSWVDRSVESGT